VGVTLVWGAPPNFAGSPTTAEAIDFKFGMQLEVAKAQDKITLTKKRACPSIWKASKIWGSLQYF